MRKFEGLLISVVYVILTLFMTYPAIVHLDSHYIGTGSDLWIFPWNDWWLRKCLLEWHNPFYTTWMFYPEGASLVYHNFAWLNTLVWLPLSPLVGPIAAYNLIFILNLALGGVSMYALARYLVGNRWAAFLAGLIFAFWPFRLAHYNHPNMISTEWVPLFLLYLIRIVREQCQPHQMRDGLLAGLFLGLTGLARWLHLALAGVLAALYLGYSLLFERQRWGKRTLIALALAGLVATSIVVPFGAPLAAAQIRRESEARDAYIERAEKGADLVGYFVPGRGHPLFRHWLGELWTRMGQESFIGYTALILALYGALRARRRTILPHPHTPTLPHSHTPTPSFWLLTAGVLFAFALGVDLHIAGQVYHLPMPYRLLQASPFTSLLREPRRLNILLGLPVAVLAAYGAKRLLDVLGKWHAASTRGRWGGRLTWAATLLLGSLMLCEYLLWPFPTVQPRVSPFYQQLAYEPGDFGLLELPMGATTPAKLYMYYATVHGKPLVEGHVSRLPESVYSFIDSLPFTYGLHWSDDIPAELNDVSRQLSALADAGVRYVILHKDLATAGRVTRWRDWLAVVPTYEDEQIVVYHTALQYGRDFRFAGEVGDGTGVISATLSTDVVAQDGLLEVKVVWGTRRTTEREWTAYLALVTPAGEDVQRVDFEPCPAWPTSEWGRDAVARGQGMLRVDPFIAGGTYTLTVGLVDPVTGVKAGKPLAVGQVEVQAVERVFAVPEMEVESEAVFGAALRLLGYDLRRADDQVVVILHWQAQRRMEVAYKFFVHLYDVESGLLVAQEDVMPRGWTYPTAWWEAGEAISDEVHLSLSGVSPGRYRLAVGVYDPQTRERLFIHGVEGLAEPSNFLVLQEVTVP